LREVSGGTARRGIEGHFCAPGRILEAVDFINNDTSLVWYEM
jgi:hypothetical protein